MGQALVGLQSVDFILYQAPVTLTCAKVSVIFTYTQGAGPDCYFLFLWTVTRTAVGSCLLLLLLLFKKLTQRQDRHWTPRRHGQSLGSAQSAQQALASSVNAST